MKSTKTPEKAVYSKPRLTVHGNVEKLTQTGTCAPHHRYNCSICCPPCPSS